MSNPVGRPTKYNPIMLEKVVEVGKEGGTLVEMAVSIGVSRDTLYEWIKSNDEFSDAVKLGIEESQVWWEKQSRLGSVGKIPNFNATMTIFNMKNRFPKDWRERQEVVTPQQQTIDLSRLTPDELTELKEALRFMKMKQIEG